MQTSTAPGPETNAPAAPAAPAAALAPISALPGLEHRLRVFADISRWATLFLGLAAGFVIGPTDIRFVASCVALAVSAVAQHAEPVSLSPPNHRARVRVVLELVLTLVAVLATGGGASPFVLTPMTAIVLSGYVWGDRIVVAVALSTGVAVAAGAAAQIGRAETGTTAAIAVIYLLCGMLGAFGRSLLTEVEEQRAATLDQATQMATANELLVALHGLAQTLPASFDLGDVVTSTRNRLRALLQFDAIVVLVRDDTGDQWVVELADGARMPERLGLDDVAGPLRRAATGIRPVVVDDLLAENETGCASLARSGVYAPLRARGSVVGLIAIEHSAPDMYGHAAAQLLENVTPLVALAIDNAKWFARLRMFGAEAERARIARELHDRIAQSLAYVAFELERLAAAGDDRHEELTSLHDVVRSIVTGLRETLYDLRSSVTEERDLESAATEFLARLGERSGLVVHWRHRVEQRLPILVEQEVWRILQEALTNVERHAGASNVWVSWTVHGGEALLQVRDDGRGFEPQRVIGDHFGLVGVRERADAMRARLMIDTEPGRGTTLSLRVEGQR